MTVARRVEPVVFHGPEGDLEGLWSDPEASGAGAVDSRAAVAGSHPPPPAAVICHPHPAHHGSMHSKVVHTIYRVLEERGHPTLRFNFRGVGKSAGTYSGWDGEMGDLAAAAVYARGRCGRRLLWISGFSFGSWIGIRYALGDAEVERVIGAGLPVTKNIDGRQFDFFDRLPWPLLLVQGDHDQYGSAADMAALRDRLAAWGRVELRVVANADHFFTGRIDALREGLVDGLGALDARRD